MSTMNAVTVAPIAAGAFRSRRRDRSGLALLLLAGAEAAAVAAAVGLIVSGLGWRAALLSFMPSNAWLAATFAPLGALVAVRRPRLALGWLLLGFAICYGLSAAGVSLAMAAAGPGTPGAGVRWAAWIGSFIWTPAVALFFPLLLLLFPDGHLPSRRWRPLVAVILVNGIAWPLSWAFQASAPGGFPYGPQPVPAAVHRVATWFQPLGNDLNGLVVLACLAALVLRWRRAAGPERAQLSWLLWGVTLAITFFIPEEFSIETVWAVVLILGVPALPVAAAIAVLRHQLFDIDLVVNRTVVYLTLSTGVVAAYLVLVWLSRLIIGGGAGSAGAVLAALLIAGAFAPARDRLQRTVDRRLFGHRRDPTAALSEVAASLTAADDDGLTAALEALRAGLRLPLVAIEIDGRRIGPTAEAGAEGGEERFELRYRAEVIGQLCVLPRRGQASLDEADRAALRLVCGPLASAVRASQLSDRLERSRRALIHAQARERRRLHRDLHDGLGPVLTALALKADAAGNLWPTDPASAARLVDQISHEAREAIDDVRRIAHELQPSALTAGLLAGLAQQAERFTQRLDGAPLHVTVEIPDELPPLPAAVESAAFRIVTEALANVARHADATTAAVRVRWQPADGLSVEVCDNGATDPPWRPGFGVRSMYRRAEDLGGECYAGATPTGGVVRARLPAGAAALPTVRSGAP
jgi:two-component system NarL family sensor kinase